MSVKSFGAVSIGCHSIVLSYRILGFLQQKPCPLPRFGVCNKCPATASPRRAAPPNKGAVGRARAEQAKDPAPPTPDYAAYSDMKADDCYKSKNHDSADLCAQWRAALAAEKAAERALWNNWISAIAAFLSLASIILVVLALRQTDRSLHIAQKDRATATRRAIASAEDTARALENAKTQIAVTEDTAKRQLRAYIAIEPHGIHEPNDGFMPVAINIINNGQTPAYNLELAGDFLIIDGDPRQFDPAKHGRLADANPPTAATDGMLGPRSNRFSYSYLESDLCMPLWNEICSKEAAIIHYGYLKYLDAFDEEHVTCFAFYHWGEELSDAESKRCRFGNSAT
jgi:hypothetical protein